MRRDARPDDEPPVVRALCGLDGHEVCRELEVLLRQLVNLCWANGWQPAEVVREVRRSDARAGRLAAWLVAADHVNRDRATMHPAWIAQVDDLPAVGADQGWLATFGRSESLDLATLLASAVRAVRVVGTVAPLAQLIPPPGARPATWRDQTARVDDPVLVRIRALLAQAESTTFEAEAEAFTAKAQELIARHAIDTALLWAQSPRDERPTEIRVPIDDPYADIKSLLLQYVAARTRCRSVYDFRHGLSTVVGFASDVATTELLFTSLLVQSQAALQAETARSLPGDHRRSRSFRSSFLHAFAQRIDQRLAEINAAVQSEATVTHGDALLPVLASRDDAVEDRVHELFGKLVSEPVRAGGSSLGWASGRLAADLAKLSFGDLEDTEPAWTEPAALAGGA